MDLQPSNKKSNRVTFDLIIDSYKKQQLTPMRCGFVREDEGEACPLVVLAMTISGVEPHMGHDNFSSDILASILCLDLAYVCGFIQGWDGNDGLQIPRDHSWVLGCLDSKAIMQQLQSVYSFN